MGVHLLNHERLLFFNFRKNWVGRAIGNLTKYFMGMTKASYM